jgi:hypothetical protein
MKNYFEIFRDILILAWILQNESINYLTKTGKASKTHLRIFGK